LINVRIFLLYALEYRNPLPLCSLAPDWPDWWYSGEGSKKTDLKHRVQPGGNSMSLIIYLVGFAFVIGGIAWALVVAKVSASYVMIAVVILIGIGILTGVTRTRTRDKAP
jgi:amino acid transporter